MAKKIIGSLKLQVKAGQANPSPPVGPALGQRGLNIMAFVKEFNAKTADIPPGTPLTYDLFIGRVHPDDQGLVERAWVAALQGAQHVTGRDGGGLLFKLAAHRAGRKRVEEERQAQITGKGHDALPLPLSATAAPQPVDGTRAKSLFPGSRRRPGLCGRN